MHISNWLYKNSVVAETLNAAKRRRLSIQRVDAHMASFISPIERWADNNYAPYELDYLYHQKPDSSEIVAPLHRRLGKGRIGEVIDVGNAGLLFFGGDLKIEFAGHPVEFGDHHVELRDLPALLVHLKSFQANDVLT